MFSQLIKYEVQMQVGFYMMMKVMMMMATRQGVLSHWIGPAAFQFRVSLTIEL